MARLGFNYVRQILLVTFLLVKPITVLQIVQSRKTDGSMLASILGRNVLSATEPFDTEYFDNLLSASSSLQYYRQNAELADRNYRRRLEDARRQAAQTSSYERLRPTDEPIEFNLATERGQSNSLPLFETPLSISNPIYGILRKASDLLFTSQQQ